MVTAVEREEGAERAAHAEVLGALRLVLGWIEGDKAIQGGHDAGAAEELAGAALDRLVSPDVLQAERRPIFCSSNILQPVCQLDLHLRSVGHLPRLS